jgi:hypothetical protein
VLLHGKACRKSAHPNCAYAADDTRATLEGVVYALDVKVGRGPVSSGGDGVRRETMRVGACVSEAGEWREGRGRKQVARRVPTAGLSKQALRGMDRLRRLQEAQEALVGRVDPWSTGKTQRG